MAVNSVSRLNNTISSHFAISKKLCFSILNGKSLGRTFRINIKKNPLLTSLFYVKYLTKKEENNPSIRVEKMEKDTFRGNLTKLKGEIQKKWGNITDQDWDKISGQKDKLIGLVQQKYGEEKESIESYLNDIMEKAESKSQEVLDSIQQKTGDVINYTHKLSECMKEEIKKNPIPSVLVSLVMGFIIGKLIK